MSSRADVCAIACAELFRDAGEIMISPMTNMASIGARLARLSFSPDILLTDGEALSADAPALGKTGAIEGWMPFGRVFETLAWGRRHVVMGANQVDRYGNQNISAFGPLQQPTRQMFGVRGSPGNTINHATSYWVGNHSKRVFTDEVDVVSGIGYDKCSTPTTQRSGSSTSTGWCPTSACSTSAARVAQCGRFRCTRGYRPRRSAKPPRSRCTASIRRKKPDCQPTTKPV